MKLLLSLLFFSTTSLAQTDLDHYIQRFRYKPLSVPSKRSALFELGKKLYSDNLLSGKGNISCKSCHSHEGFGGDSLPLGLGEGAQGLGTRRTQRNGLILGRHSQNIYNVGLEGVRNHFWDGRVAETQRQGWVTPEPGLNGLHPELPHIAKVFDSVLAVQSVFPLTSPEEMLGKESKLSRLQAWDQIMDKVLSVPAYKRLFDRAYPGAAEINIAHLGNALAEFMRHEFAAVNTPWDQYLRGKKSSLTERMKKGAVLFHTKANCFMCHNRNQFSNFTFHNIGIPQIGPDDKGRFLVSGLESDMYEFRTPPLRNVAVTAPYMHSGVFKSLFEVVEHYNDPAKSLREFRWNPRHRSYRYSLPLDRHPVRLDYKERMLSPMLSRKLNLTDEEKKDIVCFLAVGLTDASLQNKIPREVLSEIPDCTSGRR